MSKSEYKKYRAAGPENVNTGANADGTTYHMLQAPVPIKKEINLIRKLMLEEKSIFPTKALWNEVVAKLKEVQEQLVDENKTSEQKMLLNGDLKEILYANLNIIGPYKMTLMHIAAKFGWLESTNILVEKNPSLVNYANKQLLSPLSLAILHKKVKVAKCLLENKADVNVKDSKEETVLHLAVFNGDIDCVQLLLNNEINIEKPEGYHIIERIKVLNIPLFYKDFYMSALEVAKELGNHEIAKLIQEYYDTNTLSMILKEEERHLELDYSNHRQISELNILDAATNSIFNIDVFEGEEKQLELNYNNSRELSGCNSHIFSFETDVSGMQFIY